MVESLGRVIDAVDVICLNAPTLIGAETGVVSFTSDKCPSVCPEPVLANEAFSNMKSHNRTAD